MPPPPRIWKGFNDNPLFKHICTGALILGILCLAFWIRIQGVERLPEGQFTETDAYLYYKQAQTIAEQGYLPARDMDRWLPLGRDNTQLLSLYSYAIASTHKVFPWWSFYQIQLYLPVLCFTLGLGVLFLFLNRCYGVMFAFIVSVILATLPGSIERSAAGFGDRDAWCWMLGVLAGYQLLVERTDSTRTAEMACYCTLGVRRFLGWHELGSLRGFCFDHTLSGDMAVL